MGTSLGTYFKHTITAGFLSDYHQKATSLYEYNVLERRLLARSIPPPIPSLRTIVNVLKFFSSFILLIFYGI